MTIRRLLDRVTTNQVPSHGAKGSTALLVLLRAHKRSTRPHFFRLCLSCARALKRATNKCRRRWGVVLHFRKTFSLHRTTAAVYRSEMAAAKIHGQCELGNLFVVRDAPASDVPATDVHNGGTKMNKTTAVSLLSSSRTAARKSNSTYACMSL